MDFFVKHPRKYISHLFFQGRPGPPGPPSPQNQQPQYFSNPASYANHKVRFYSNYQYHETQVVNVENFLRLIHLKTLEVCKLFQG